MQPAEEPLPFLGGNEYDLLDNIKENGKISKLNREQLNSLVEWVKQQ